MNYYAREIEKLKSKDNFRTIRDIEEKQEKYIIQNCKKLINFSSNDYLNLSIDKVLVREFLDKCKDNNEFLFSSASSRLLSGTSRIYNRPENNLAEMFRKEACLLFNTGYQCNLGVVSALIGRDDVIF